MRTPWGRASSVDVVADGVIAVSTATHGGFFLSPTRNREVPACFRALSRDGLAREGWYEEDADSCFVALTFPELFDADEIAGAKLIYDTVFRPKLIEVKAPAGCASIVLVREG
jgi:hypothetical protein